MVDATFVDVGEPDDEMGLNITSSGSVISAVANCKAENEVGR